MSLTRTTLSGAVAASDKSVLLASISGLSAGQTIQINGEKMRVQSVPAAATIPVPVFRGIEGTNVAAHAASAGVIFGDGSDFAANLEVIPVRRRSKANYSAAGAIALPTPGTDAFAALNGTTVLAMTLANPSKDADGDILIVAGDGKAAHTITYTAGLGDGGSGLDVLTFAAGARQVVQFVACNERWVASILGGTLTNVTVTAA